jgi:hypothetical protein
MPNAPEKALRLAPKRLFFFKGVTARNARLKVSSIHGLL